MTPDRSLLMYNSCQLVMEIFTLFMRHSRISECETVEESSKNEKLCQVVIIISI